MTMFDKTKIKVGRFFVFIRQYAHMLVHEKTRLRPISHWTFMTSLSCSVGLYYSSASINQLFNTKNSFLQLLSRKATLKCEVLFKVAWSATVSCSDLLENDTKCVYWQDNPTCQVSIFPKSRFWVMAFYVIQNSHWLTVCKVFGT